MGGVGIQSKMLESGMSGKLIFSHSSAIVS